MEAFVEATSTEVSFLLPWKSKVKSTPLSWIYFILIIHYFDESNHGSGFSWKLSWKPLSFHESFHVSFHGSKE